MYSGKVCGVIAAVFFLAASTSANAALVFSYLHPDLVLDTETGLIWMPVDSSADDLATYSAFGQNQRLAGSAELFDLFGREFGLSFGGENQMDQAAFDKLLDFSGLIAGSTQDPGFGLCPAGDDCISVSGAYFDGPSVSLPVPRDVVAFEVGFMYFWEDNGEYFGGSTSTLGGWSIPECADDPGGFSCAGAQSWLVMTAVPLPAAIWMLLSGLAGLIGLRRTYTYS